MTSQTPSTNTNSDSTMTLLDQLLVDKSDAVKYAVLKILKTTQIRDNDVMFMVMIAIGQVEGLLIQSPKELASLFESWESSIFDKLKEVERVAIKSQQTAIAHAVRDLIKKTDFKQTLSFFKSVVPAFGLLVSTLGIGALLGMSVPVWLQGGYMTDKPRKLTLAEAETLQWGMSREGKFARDLTKWNPNLIPYNNSDCLKDVKRLNVTLKVQGKDTLKGWCAIWVLPPNQRQYLKN